MAPPPVGLRITRRAITHPDAVLLVEEVQAEYVLLYGSPDDAPIAAAEFEPGRGAFLVGYLDEAERTVPVASGAWRWHDVDAVVLEQLRTAGQEVPDVAGGGLHGVEIKRMYVRAAYRRRGLARHLLAALEADARAAGAAYVVLETGTMQPEAMALYADCGYELVVGFGHYRRSEMARAYAKML